MKDKEFLQEEILEIGRQESRNFRTSIILSGLLISSISFISQHNTPIVNQLSNSTFFMLAIGLIMASIMFSYSVNLLRWLTDDLLEAENTELKKYVSIQRTLIAGSRASLMLSVLAGFYAAAIIAADKLGTNVLIPVFSIALSILIMIYYAWRLK